MIARKYLDNYSEIILNSLNLYSDNTTLRVSNSMTSDETLLKMEKLMKDNPTEQELIKRLGKNFPQELKKNSRLMKIMILQMKKPV